MTKYINRQVMIDAYRLTEQASPVPSWLLRPQFARVLNEKGGISHGLVSQAQGLPTRVEVGDWIINDRGVLIKMTDKEFTDKYAPAEESVQFMPQLELFNPDHEPDDCEDGDWFTYDSSKPVSLMSIRDYIFLELLKTRMQVLVMDVDGLLDDHFDKVDLALTAMGYD